jgi:hypothetical protein
MNIYEKLQTARVQLQKAKLKKSGKNAYTGFEYFELGDFLPKVNEIFLEQGLCTNFSSTMDTATLHVINSEKPEEVVEFTMPVATLQLKGCSAMQALGGVNTYAKRYLYLNALEIVEADMLDAKAGSIDSKPIQKDPKPEINPDMDLIQGLEATVSTDEALRYYRANNANAKDVEGFRALYMKHYKKLQAKETGENNGK